MRHDLPRPISTDAAATGAPVLPTVTVIVPHYADLAGLDLCLSRLAAQSYPADRFAIIVGDNGSPCGKEAVAATIAGRAMLVIEPRKGAGLARNAAAAQASGDILAFIDSDCQAQPGWLSAGVAALADAGLVGGAVTIIAPEQRDHNGVEAFEATFAFAMRAYVEVKGFAGSGNLFVRRADFARVGGFVTGKSEDMEWSHRATALGLRLRFCAAALVAHPPRRNWAELTAKWRRVSAELYGIAAPRPLGRWRWALRSLVMPLSAVAHLPRMLTQPGLSWPARLRGAAVLVAIRCWRMGYGLKLALRPPPP
jgi:glycosyltransferase involved in cell wall biosynthesis